MVEPALVLYDGECGLCSRGVLFVYRRDPQGRFAFASLQSALGRRLLREHGLPEDRLDTLVLVQDGRAWTRSDAALRIGRGLRLPWRWLAALGWLAPRRLRDAAYDIIARRRHRLGLSCPAPPAGLRARMRE